MKTREKEKVEGRMNKGEERQDKGGKEGRMEGKMKKKEKRTKKQIERREEDCRFFGNRSTRAS